jgi:hypothetical protein
LPNYVSITRGIVVPSNASTLSSTSTNGRKMLVAMEPLEFEKPLELEKLLEVMEPLKVEELLGLPLIHKIFC